MEWKTVYLEIKDLAHKLDAVKSDISELREEIAEHRVKIEDSRKLHSTLWGIIGGSVSAAGVAMIDLIFRK